MNFWVWKHRIWCQHWLCRSWMAKKDCFLYFCNILWFLKRLLIPNLFEEIVTRLGNVVEFNHFVWICAKMRISEWSELRPGPLRTLQLPLINQSEAVLDPQSVKGLNRSSIGRRGWVRNFSHLLSVRWFVWLILVGDSDCIAINSLKLIFSFELNHIQILNPNELFN